MKAVYFDGKIKVCEQDFPSLEPGEALVKVDLAGICGTDLEILQGYMSYEGILGHEFVGTVVKSENLDLAGKRIVGEINAGCGACAACYRGMERHCPNRTVLGILGRGGAFAEYLSLPERNLHVLPDLISDRQAVFVEPLAAAFEIKEQISLNPEWRAAIVGDGRLAQLIVRVLKMSCPDVVCFGHHPAKLGMLEELQVKTKIGVEKNDERSFDLVVEATGNVSGFSDAIRLARPRGTVILKSTIASKGSLDLTPTVINEITLVGSRCGLFRPAIDALAARAISVDSMMGPVFSLENFQEAVRCAKEPDTLKVFLRP